MKLDLSKTAYLEVVLDEAEVRIEVYQAFDLIVTGKLLPCPCPSWCK